jgi:hypothetical protein
MLDRYGFLGTGSGIAIALYVFSLIEKHTIHVSNPSNSIRLPSRAEGDGMLSLVFVAEWGAVALFVLAELLSGEFQTWLKVSAVTSGGSIAVIYALCVMRVNRKGLINSGTPEKKPSKRGPRRRQIRGGIRTRD